MSNTLLGIVGMIYMAVAAQYWAENNPGMAIAFVAYALANLGFIIAHG